MSYVPFCPRRGHGIPRSPKAATVHAHFERKVASTGEPLYRRKVSRLLTAMQSRAAALGNVPLGRAADLFHRVNGQVEHGRAVLLLERTAQRKHAPSVRFANDRPQRPAHHLRALLRRRHGLRLCVIVPIGLHENRHRQTNALAQPLRIAETRMYQAKSAYYQDKNILPRGR